MKRKEFSYIGIDLVMYFLTCSLKVNRYIHPMSFDSQPCKCLLMQFYPQLVYTGMISTVTFALFCVRGTRN